MLKFGVTGSGGFVILFTVRTNVWEPSVFEVIKLNTLSFLVDAKKLHCGVVTEAPVEEVIEAQTAWEFTLG